MKHAIFPRYPRRRNGNSVFAFVSIIGADGGKFRVTVDIPGYPDIDGAARRTAEVGSFKYFSEMIAPKNVSVTTSNLTSWGYQFNQKQVGTS